MTPTSTVVILPSGTRVPIPDAWAANPLAEGYKALNPALYAVALRDAPVPTMFSSGDLPPFTASGTDPSFLTWLPFQVRHQAAIEETKLQVLEMIEEFGKDPDSKVQSEGLFDYMIRFSEWLKGNNPGTGMYTPPDDDDHGVYQSLVGTQDAARQAQVAAVNNAAKAQRAALTPRTTR